MILNAEQLKIIQSIPNGQMLIKGVAGSGKTTVALYKIPLLINNYCHEIDDNILFVTYAKMLVNYVDHMYQEIKEDEIMKCIASNNTDKKMEIKSIDSLIYRYFDKLMKQRKREYSYMSPNEATTILKEALKRATLKYPEEKILNDLMFMKSEIEWIKACRYVDWDVYREIDRKGRFTKKEGLNSYRLKKNSKTRQAIIETLYYYNEIIDKRSKYDYKDKALILLEAIKNDEISLPKYTHIIIDESQDLSRIQLEVLENLYNHKKSYAGIYFVADTAQSIYNQSWLSYNSFKSIGFSMNGKTKILDKNYRTTNEIGKAAYSLVEKDLDITGNENYVTPNTMDRSGEYPILKGFENIDQEMKYIYDTIQKRLSQKYELKEICVVARTKSQLIALEKYMNKNHLPAEMIQKDNPNFQKDCIKLMTMHSIKGLEFNVLFIMGINDKIIPYKSYSNGIDEKSMERRLLYVSMTRAKERLYMTYYGAKSEFIDDIDPNWLKDEEYLPFEQVTHIGVENYKYHKNIVDIYSKEEIVRQWALQELHTKLGYEYDNIFIEHRIQNFSKTGFLDIAILNPKNNQIYIVGEIKSENQDISFAIQQLKSYMNAQTQIPYGFASNGKITKFFKRAKDEIIEINKLPMYKPTPELKNLRKYVDLQNLNTLEFSYDCSGHIFQMKNDIEETDILDNGVEIGVYGEVAAGLLTIAEEEFLEKIEMPKEIIKSKENCFLLKVKGDSMIEANIEPGDHVLVKKQNVAESRDIVIGVVEDEATIKRYMPMGESILLVPENKKYEPILVKSKDLYINGKVIGVLKK